MLISGWMRVHMLWRWWALFWVAAIIAYRARFIAPWRVKYHYVDMDRWLQKKIVLISDLHIGIFKNEHFLQNIVDAINQLEDVDIVVIAGDITYEPLRHQIEKLLQPLASIRFPTYAVLGNHDTWQPWPDIADEIRRVLVQYGVEIIENKYIDKWAYILAGLWDFRAQEDDVTSLDDICAQRPAQNPKPVICLVHNPDSTLKYEQRVVDITLAGHTHGAQIRIPWMKKWTYDMFLQLIGPFDHGVHYQKLGIVYVSNGLGEVGVPRRRGSSPTIDILHL